MPDWDVFHSDRLEIERGLSTAEVRAALARGDLREDDLIRPAGTTVTWGPLADLPAFAAPEPAPEPHPPVPDLPIDQTREWAIIDDDYEDAAPPEFPEDDDDEADPPRDDDLGALDLDRRMDSGSRLALPVAALGAWDESAADDEPPDPQDEDEEAAEFTLSRGGPGKVEELDLAAMVDVAFQLVLFFLVTATTILYKSLEVPKPNPEAPAQTGAQQGHSRSLDDLKDAYIIVDIDPEGTMKIDREPVAAEISALIERLRTAREKTGRKSMLLTADYRTQHKNAVLAYDAANEIGMGIAIARPTPPTAANPPAAPAQRPGPAARKPS